MESLPGISGGGRDAETRFVALTGAELAPRAVLGDAILEGYYVEIKRAGTATLNQVRAVKYLTLVAYHYPEPCWYVVPPQHVVAHAARRGRGQHTENPFESITVSLNALSEFRIEDESQLRERTLAAAREGEQYPEIKDAMTWVLEQSRALAQASTRRVLEAIQRHGLA